MTKNKETNLRKIKETNLRKIKNANIRIDDLEEERYFLSGLIRELRKELKILIRK